MTRKEALATLYRLRDAYLDLLYAQDRATFAASEGRRHESYRALMTLVDALHGKPRGVTASLFLCEVCYLRRADLSITSELLWVCAPCHKNLAANAVEVEPERPIQKLARVQALDGVSLEETGSTDQLPCSLSYASSGWRPLQERGGA